VRCLNRKPLFEDVSNARIDARAYTPTLAVHCSGCGELRCFHSSCSSSSKGVIADAIFVIVCADMCLYYMLLLRTLHRTQALVSAEKSLLDGNGFDAMDYVKDLKVPIHIYIYFVNIYTRYACLIHLIHQARHQSTLKQAKASLRAAMTHLQCHRSNITMLTTVLAVLCCMYCVLSEQMTDIDVIESANELRDVMAQRNALHCERNPTLQDQYLLQSK
jgi:hypothetical protein